MSIVDVTLEGGSLFKYIGVDRVLVFLGEFV